jgi:hypothetical protein
MNRIGRGSSWMFAVALLATPSLSFAQAVQFTDWTSANLAANTATGNLGGVTVTFSGGDLVAAFLSQQITGFNSALYTPPLATSDALEIVGTSSAPTYVINFSTRVNNPVIHLKSFASTLDFGGLTVVKLSGESSLTVSGSTVSGVADDNPNGHDSNGTIQLPGLFTSLSFTASFPTTDGIDMQIGAGVPAVPGLAPALLSALAAALGLLGMISVRAARRRVA